MDNEVTPSEGPLQRGVSAFCMNLAAAVNVVLYDRAAKEAAR